MSTTWPVASAKNCPTSQRKSNDCVSANADPCAQTRMRLPGSPAFTFVGSGAPDASFAFGGVGSSLYEDG